MVRLLFLFSCISVSDSPSEVCGMYSNADCDYCLSNIGNYSCGYCIDDKRCVPGDDHGPFVGTCLQWERNKKSDACQKDSYLGFPTGVKIAIGCVVGVLIVVTLVFWITIFPKVFREKQTGVHQVSVEF